MRKYLSLGLVGILFAFTLAGCHGGPSSSQSSRTTASMPPPRTAASASTAGQGVSSTKLVAAATHSMAKLTPELAAMVKQVQAAPDASTAHALSNQRIHVNAKGQIQVYVYVNHFDAETESRLAGAGAMVERGVAAMKVYQAWATPEVLARISSLSVVVRITSPAYGFPKQTR